MGGYYGNQHGWVTCTHLKPARDLQGGHAQLILQPKFTKSLATEPEIIATSANLNKSEHREMSISSQWGILG